MIPNKKVIINVIIVFIIFGLSFGFSSAYFLTNISGNDTASSINLKTAHIAINLIDGPDVSISSVEPGATIEKTVTVVNPSGNTFNYSLVWEEIDNGFSNPNLLTYTIACNSYSDYSDLDTPDVPSQCTGEPAQYSPTSSTSQIGIIDDVDVPAYSAHKYVLTLTVSNDIPTGIVVSFSGIFGMVEGSYAATHNYVP